MTTDGGSPRSTPAAGAAPSAGAARRGRVLLLLASVAGALSNFGILFAASHVLDVIDNSEFIVFWGVLFGLFGVQSGVQNETTRATTSPRREGARAMTAGALWGAISAVVLLATAVLWAPVLLPGSAVAAAAVLVVTALLYPLYVTLVGAFGGSRRFDLYGTTLLVEVVLRVALVLAVAAAGLGLRSMEAASAAPVLTLAIMLAASGAARTAARRRADVPLPRLLRHGGLAMISTACTALLVTAYPALVRLTTSPAHLGLDARETATALGACLLAVSLTRAPIMIPLTAFVGVAISAFTGHRGGVWAAVRTPFTLLAGVGLLGAAAAWPVGPWFLRAFKPEYDLPGWYFSALTASSVLMAWLTILGALALATSRHVLYVLGWGIASAIAVVCLLLPLPLTTTTALSVSLGPAAGCAALLALLPTGAAKE